MAYKPTGYKPGRPRKGEIRPETPGGKAIAKWRAENREAYLAQNRKDVARFRESSPYRWDEIQRDVILRKKLWGPTKLKIGDFEDGVEIVDRPDSQVIIAQVDLVNYYD